MANVISNEQFKSIYPILERSDARDLIDALVVLDGSKSDESAIHYAKLLAAVTTIRLEKRAEKSENKSAHEKEPVNVVRLPKPIEFNRINFGASKAIFPNGTCPENASYQIKKIYSDIIDAIKEMKSIELLHLKSDDLEWLRKVASANKLY